MKNKVPTLEQTIAYASQCHEGQIDKMGQPYIFHPLRVMLMLLTFVDRTVAMLHDVVEDCDITFGQLKEQGYPSIITEAVDALTKRKDEAYDDYLQRVSSNPVAIRVKKADLLDNISPVRRYNLAPGHRSRLHAKYTHALEVLRQGELKMAEDNLECGG